MLVIGEIEASPGFWLHDIAHIAGSWQKVPLECHGIDAAKQRIAYSGYSTDELLAAIEATAPDPDACVVFDGFDGRNEQLASALTKQRFFSGTVALVELAEPKPFMVYDMYADDGEVAEHTARRLLRVDGKSGPDSLRGTPFMPILEEQLGKRLKSACTQS